MFTGSLSSPCTAVFVVIVAEAALVFYTPNLAEFMTDTVSLKLASNYTF